MTGGRRLEGRQSPNATTHGARRSGAPTSGAPRLGRGAVVGVTAMGLALAGHVAGGGSLPTPTSAGALLALSVAGSVALSGRRWTLSALLVMLLGVQVVFHVAFGGHPSAAGFAAHRHAAHSLGVSMVSAHLLAALTAALLLRRGESWCWRLVALLSRPVQIARVFGAHPVPASAARSVQSPDRPLPALRSLLLADAQPRRGPPAVLAR
jgi:hypothetical protein